MSKATVSSRYIQRMLYYHSVYMSYSGHDCMYLLNWVDKYVAGTVGSCLTWEKGDE